MSKIQGSLKGLLGDLQGELMTWLWQQPAGDITVRQVYEAVGLTRKPHLAYTTIMTVMGHLVDKGLLNRRLEGKTHYYQVAQSREEFLAASAAKQAAAMVAHFGDLALAQFAEQLAASDPQRLARIQALLEKGESLEE